MIFKSVGNNFENDAEDARRVRDAFDEIDFLQEEEKETDFENKPLGMITRNLDKAIKRFQRENNLREDGYIKPGGETETALVAKQRNKRDTHRPLFSTVHIPKDDETQKIGIYNDGRINKKVFADKLKNHLVLAASKTVREDKPESETDNEKIENAESEPVEEEVTLLAPTLDPVEKEKLQQQLDYDPIKGGGDFNSVLKHGLEPNNIAIEARKAARQKFRYQKGINDDQDAFRHAYGSYLMTKKYGAGDAKVILDRHERKPGKNIRPKNVDGSMLQDLYNNKVGRDAALDPKNKDRDPFEVIEELYSEGKLQTRPFRLKRKNNKKGKGK